jgi:hypothetical protein
MTMLTYTNGEAFGEAARILVKCVRRDGLAGTAMPVIVANGSPPLCTSPSCLFESQNRTGIDRLAAFQAFSYGHSVWLFCLPLIFAYIRDFI